MPVRVLSTDIDEVICIELSCIAIFNGVNVL